VRPQGKPGTKRSDSITKRFHVALIEAGFRKHCRQGERVGSTSSAFAAHPTAFGCVCAPGAVHLTAAATCKRSVIPVAVPVSVPGRSFGVFLARREESQHQSGSYEETILPRRTTMNHGEGRCATFRQRASAAQCYAPFSNFLPKAYGENPIGL